MEAKELMIGDWVRMRLSFGTQWYTEKVGCVNPENELEYEPIPLTAEILEKNGFVTNISNTLTGSHIYHRLCGKYEDYKVSVRLLNGWVKIESFDDKWHTLFDLSIQPRYIHELQHALRLCGLNELADNFEI